MILIIFNILHFFSNFTPQKYFYLVVWLQKKCGEKIMSGLNFDYDSINAQYRATRVTPYLNSYSPNPTPLPDSEGDGFVSSLIGAVGSGNTCTDGLDDGKIGLGSVISNIGQGAIRSVGNGIKGMFFDSEGKFSLSRTLTTAAVIGVCGLCPYVAMAACGIGVVTGGSQIIKGVFNAVNATTDAEAKTAWENVGAGGLTLATSVVGAKASYNATISAASKTANGSAMQTLSNGNTNLFSVVKQNGLRNTTKAFATDCANATKYNFSQLKTGVSNLFNTCKNENKQRNELNKMYQDSKKADFDPRSLTKEEQEILNQVRRYGKDYDPANVTEKAFKQFHSDYLKDQVKIAKESGDKTAIENAKKALNEFNKKDNSTGIFTNIANWFKNKTQNARSAISELATKENGKKSILQFGKNCAKLDNLKSIGTGLSDNAAAIIKVINSSGFNSAVQQFGYENAIAALETMAAVELVNSSV